MKLSGTAYAMNPCKVLILHRVHSEHILALTATSDLSMETLGCLLF